MSSPIRHAQAMPQAQVRFKQRFTTLMTQTAQQISGLILRAADDDGLIPVESMNSLTVQALRLIDQLFVSNDGRTAIRNDGMPLSPYARVLLEEIGRVTVEIVDAHSRYLRRTMPGEVRRWLDTSSRRLGEMGMSRHAPTMVAEQLTLDELRRRFPNMSEADLRTVRDLRLFEPNPLAEYEAAHTWVDPRGYRLSDRIWRTDQKTRQDLNDFMIDMISSGMPAQKIAENLEQWLIPGRQKIRTNKSYGSDGSFDAMRLARTEISHAANQTAFISAYTNPYVNAIEVARSPNGDVNCKICPQHATLGFGGERLRPAYSVHAANVPPYHPHDMCRVESVVTDSPDVVTERLRRMMQISREVNLAPVMTPTQIDDFIQSLLGEVLWNITRQVLPAQPRLF